MTKGVTAAALALLALLLLAGCRAAPTSPSATAPFGAPSPTPAAAITATAAPVSPVAASSATAGAPGGATPAVAREMTVCLVGEPSSLYRYARPEPGRDHILAALTDGPIDNAGFGYQPVLIERLPSLAGGDALLRMVDVVPGEMVLDTLGRARPLGEGVSVRLADGGDITYTGTLPARLPQLVATFHLRPNLRWSDGEPLTAADSVFAYQLGRSPEAVDPLADAAQGTDRYQASDDLTVVWTGLPGNLDPQYFANFWPPLPRHQLGGLTPAEVAASAEANRAPLSYGPFALREWAAGGPLVMERNPYYWRAAEGLPRLDRLIYRFAAGADQLIADLRSGACDLAPSGPAVDAAGAALDAAAQAGGLVHYATPGSTLLHLDFNFEPAGDYTGAAGSGLFKEARLRQALAYCIDRVSLSGGQAPPAAYLPRGHPLYAAGAVEYAFSPERGRGLLAELGWSDSDQDGVVERGGEPLRLSLAGGAAQAELMAAIRQQLQANCGAAVDLRTLTRGELEDNWPDGIVFGRRFDLAAFGWRIGAATPCALFTTAEIAGPDNPSGANDTGYNNAAFDAACQHAQLATDTDAAARDAEAQQIFAADLPVLPLFFQPRHAAARLGVKGYALDPSAGTELWNVEEIDRTR